MGLAIEVILDEESGEEKLGGIWDYRHDTEGLYYDIFNSDIDRKKRFKSNETFINDELERRSKQRKEILGFSIEPIK